MNSEHLFELAGLGFAPFRFVRLLEQPGSVCAYCGQEIEFCHEITDVNGETFVVGGRCVNKTDDASMMSRARRARKKAETVRQMARVRDMADRLENDEDLRDSLRAIPHSRFWKNTTKLDEAIWIMRHAALSGRMRLIREIEKAGL